MARKKSGGKEQWIATGIIVIIILATVAAIVLMPRPQKEVAKGEEIVIDDRISPLTNQGIIVEVERVRHRGLLDKLLTPFSREWKNKPSFYVEVTIDGKTFSSKNATILKGGKEYLYVTWDTWDADFKEFRMVKDVEEEKPTSKVTITIVERVNYGILGRKTKDIERDSFTLTYDYRTGRWSGDDYLYDKDGYGHFVGEYFEVWFNIYQTDFDGDGIPYWTEVNVLHTSPFIDDSKMDPDGDGIPTSWEWKWGYDPFTWDNHKYLDPDLDGIENVEEYRMSEWLANPFTPDIYVEVDIMEKGSFLDINRKFYEESKQALIERFCQHGINLYIDDGWPDSPKNGGGDKVPYTEVASQDTGSMLEYYERYFPDERKGIFRYVVIGHEGAFCIPSKFNRYDTIHVSMSRKSFFEYLAFGERAKRVAFAKKLMHELGHSLGITPWSIQGCDNTSIWGGREEKKRFIQTWANYKSVMNYYWLAGWFAMPIKHLIQYWKFDFLDYSDGSNPPYDQNDWTHLYLPTFEIDATVIEDPFFAPPGVDKIVLEDDKNISRDGWILLENLSDALIEKLELYCMGRLSKSSPYENGVEWRVYVKENATDGEINARVYARPKVYPTHAIWSPVAEGYFDGEDITFYSQTDIVNSILEMVESEN